MTTDALIVDDEADIRRLVADILKDEGYSCRTAGDAGSAISAVEKRRPDLVVLDIWLEGSDMDGMALLQDIRRRCYGAPVIMISGHGNVETAVAAIKLGAYDFIEKPFKADRLVVTANRAVEAARLLRENTELRRRAGDAAEIVGVSMPIRRLRAALDRVAPTDSRVLISGPPGSGKEVFARQLHLRSPRATNPFVVVNCAALAPDRVEVELFGRVEAPDIATRGTLELAHGGTLLLDGVGDMPLESQGKIVRVLQDLTFNRVGGEGAPIQVDVRFIASTSRDMEEEMAAGRFRQDFFYRLNVVPIRISPLRDRREDVPVLIEHFMAKSAAASGFAPRPMSEEAIATLQAYDWPGNVRQLRNVVDWILIMAPGEPGQPVTAAGLPPEVGGDGSAIGSWEEGARMISLPLREARETFERQYLLAQVSRFGGNVSRTAEFIGMERSALHRKLKLLGVQVEARDG